MKKAAFFSLILATYYLAGMYRYPMLMLLCVMEALLLVISFFLPRYFRRSLSVVFPKQSEWIQKGLEVPCRVKAGYAGRLPVSRFALCLRLGYRQEAKHTAKKLYAGSERGESGLEFKILAPYCGLVQVRLNSLRIYDYLSLFSVKKAFAEEMKIAVFPKDQALHIELSSFGLSESNPSDEQTVSRAGDAHNEIRQIREYRTGDSNRHIHWNQSAKTDDLWIKEYEKETDSQAHVLLDTEGFHNATAEKMNAFYELLSALALGLLKSAATVRVYWYDSAVKGLVSADAGDTEQCREMLLLIYRSDFQEADEPCAKALIEKGVSLGENFLKLNLKLDLYLDNTLLFQFSEKELEREITEKVLVL